jgi:PAS domain S-box-containing protein
MSIIPVLFSYLFISSESKNLLYDNSIAKLNDIAALQHKRVRQLLKNKHESVKLISNRAQLKLLVEQIQKTYSVDTKNKILNILEYANNSASNIKKLSIISLDQNIIVSTDKGVNHKYINTFIHSNKATEDSFNIQVFKGKGNRLIILFLEKLYIKNQHIGYISVEFSNQELVKIISDNTGLGVTGEIVIAGRNLEGDTMFLTPTRHNENSAFNIIIPKEKLDIPITYAMKGQSIILKDYVDYRSVPVLAISHHIPEVDWGMIVKIDQEEAFQQLNYLESHILQLVALVIGIALFMSVFLGNKISEPIRALEQVVLGIGKGNIKLRAKKSKLTEINRLGNSFNEMFSSQLSADVALHDAIKQLTTLNGQLQSEAERFKRWKESNFIGIIHSDAKGNILDANTTLLNMIGYSQDDLLKGRIDWQHLTPEEFLPLDLAAIEEAEKNGFWTPFEKQYLHKDGRRIPILIGGSLFKYDSKEFIVFIIDLTDRNKQLDALEKYKRIIEDSNDLIAYVDTNYQFKMVNPTYCNYQGLSQSQIENHYIVDVLGKEVFFEKIKPLIDRALLGEIVKSTGIMNFKTLGEKLLNVTYTPYKNDEGNILGFIFRGEDITELENHRQLIQSTKIEQVQLINSMLEGVLTTDEACTILTFNPEAENIFGYKENEIIGKNVSVLIPIEHSVKHDSYLKGFFKTNVSTMVGNRQGRRVFALHKDQHKFPLRISIAELPQSSPNRAKFISIFQDLTEFERQNEIINRSLRMESLGNVAGGIAHDFNNILGIITGYCSLLMDIPTTEKNTRYLSAISKASDRGANLTKNLLTFSKNKSSSINVVSINDVILMNKDMLETLLTSKITLQLSLGKGLLLTSVDKSLLEDSLLNISINALHAMPSGGKLQIRTENTVLSADDKYNMPFQAGQYVKLTIEDNGCGMSEEVVSHIFEPFYTTKGNVGHGLGLSQCYGFVKSSKGVITVDSLIDKGSVFSIYLPVTEEKVVSNQSPKPLIVGGSPVDEKNYTALIVDDENPIRLLNSTVLSNAGYTVYSFDNAVEALELLSNEHIDIIVTDVVMPQMGGVEFIEKAKKLVPSIKYLFVSGYLNEKDTVQAEKIKPLLNKPYTGSELITAVKKLFNDENRNM